MKCVSSVRIRSPPAAKKKYPHDVLFYRDVNLIFPFLKKNDGGEIKNENGGVFEMLVE